MHASFVRYHGKIHARGALTVVSVDSVGMRARPCCGRVPDLRVARSPWQLQTCRAGAYAGHDRVPDIDVDAYACAFANGPICSTGAVLAHLPAASADLDGRQKHQGGSATSNLRGAQPRDAARAGRSCRQRSGLVRDSNHHRPPELRRRFPQPPQPANLRPKCACIRATAWAPAVHMGSR